MPVVYSHNISISPQFRSGPENPVNAPQELGEAFVQGTIQVIDRARAASASFNALIVALIHSGHPIVIFMARNKKHALFMGPNVAGERNVTGDTLQALLLSRVEGSAYAQNRAQILEALRKAVAGTNYHQSFTDLLQKNLGPNWEMNTASLIQERIWKQGRQKQFDAFLTEVVNAVKTLPAGPVPVQDEGGGYAARRRAAPKSEVDPRFNCEVFTADAVHTPVNFYKPLYERVGASTVVEAALSRMSTTVRREVEGEIRTLLGRPQGPIDVSFLRKCELNNPRGYLMTKLRLERYLLPNVGCGSNITFNLHAKRASPDMEKQQGPPTQNSPWGYRPVEVGLAHELIHAWRNASGRTIFGPNSFEDESMVIGTNNVPSLFPQFTENRIREELKLAPRPLDTRPSMFLD